jgi:exopolysaccharide biosynthesis polyprenyl glycosylphosphotransferase
MKMKEKIKRLIKLLFAEVLMCLILVIYHLVWTDYYNKIIESPFWRRGNWMMVFLYGVLLFFFMKMYGGFKVGYLRKGNLIYSQMLAVFLTNIFTYLQIAVLDKHFLSPWPLLIMTVVDSLVIIFWTLFFQKVYLWLFPPRRMLLVSGNRSDYHLMEKMNTREDKYEIKEAMNYREGFEFFTEKVQNYDGVIVGDMPSHERNQIIKFCFEKNIRTYSVPKISDILLRSSDELTLFDSPLLLSRNDGLTIEQLFIKRMVDILLSVVGLVISAPFFIIVAMMIKLTDSGPVFYGQTRLTLDGRVFEIYKFRTMIQNAEKDTGPQLAREQDERILPVGHFLRRFRLDELPQLINVLKGDMSLVGPRPERPELASEIEKTIPEFPYRLKVKAGLTGYAQIYGKYNTTSYDKLKLDLTYIRNYSAWLDIKLILMTPKIMMMRESSEGIIDKKD